MAKPVIFISHINEEAQLAALIKGHIQEAFLDMIDVFVSSDGQSIRLGRQWLDEVSANLKITELMIVLSTQGSVTRPWINFEAGAAWVRGIDIVPICHTNLRPGELPLPLKLLQGMDAGDERRWREMYRVLAKKLKSREPSPDFAKLVGDIKAFEEEYRETIKTAEAARAGQAAPTRGSPRELAIEGAHPDQRDKPVVSTIDPALLKGRQLVRYEPEYLMDMYKDQIETQADREFAPYKGGWMPMRGTIISKTGAHTLTFLYRPGSIATIEMMFNTEVWGDPIRRLVKGDPVMVLGQIKSADRFHLYLENCELLEVPDGIILPPPSSY